MRDRHRGLCRNRPRSSRVRSHHTRLGQSRAQRCRIPDTCERLGQHVGLWRVMVVLPVELACTCEFEPSLEIFGNRLVQQGTLRVARVVEFGFGARLPTRVRMRVRLRWACGGGHGAVPAWVGCPMILGLYPASHLLMFSAGRSIAPELIAAYANYTRATGRFTSQTQCLEDAVHALLHPGIHGDGAAPFALGLARPFVTSICCC